MKWFERKDMVQRWRIVTNKVGVEEKTDEMVWKDNDEGLLRVLVAAEAVRGREHVSVGDEGPGAVVLGALHAENCRSKG